MNIDERDEILRHKMFIKALQDGSALDKETFNTPELWQEHINQRNFLLRADVQLRQFVPIQHMRKRIMELMDMIAYDTGVEDLMRSGKEQEAKEKQVSIQEQQEILDDFTIEMKKYYTGENQP